jgi:tetratricopeptide (TPR) repeat protein
MLVAVAVALGVVFGTRDRAPEPPPSATRELRENGVTVARLDAAALSAWCDRHDLPPPPGVEEVEPAFADAFLAALRTASVEGSAEGFGTVGMLCESMESHGSAEAYFLRAAEAAPQDPRWPYYLGCLYQVTGRLDEARRLLDRSRELDPSYPMTYGRLGQMALEAGELDEADAHFAEYDRLRPNDGFGPLGTARVALRRGDPQTALAALQEAEARGMNDFQFHRAYGSAYAALGERERAAEAFARSEGLPQGLWYRVRDPRDQALHDAGSPVSALQAEFARLGASEDWAALAELGEEILERRPGDVRMMGNLVGLYRKLGRFEDARRLLDRAFSTGEDTLRLHLLRSETRLAEGDYAGARESADRARKLDDRSARAWSLRARALLMEGDAPGAEAAMTTALSLQPDDPSNLLVLGEIRRSRGDPDGAAEAYRDVLDLQDNPVARDRLEHLFTSERDSSAIR